VLQSISTLNAKRFTLAGQTWSLEPGHIGVRNHGVADQTLLPAFAEVSPG
jgi:hypothetical protein